MFCVPNGLLVNVFNSLKPKETNQKLAFSLGRCFRPWEGSVHMLLIVQLLIVPGVKLPLGLLRHSLLPSHPCGVLRRVSFVVHVHLGTCDAWTFPSQCFRKARIQRSHPPQSSPHIRKQIVFYFRNNASLNLRPVMAFSHCFRLEAMGRSTLIMEEEACGGSDFSEGCC